MSEEASSPRDSPGAQLAAVVERRWAMLVILILVVFIAVAAFAGIHHLFPGLAARGEARFASDFRGLRAAGGCAWRRFVLDVFPDHRLHGEDAGAIHGHRATNARITRTVLAAGY